MKKSDESLASLAPLVSAPDAASASESPRTAEQIQQWLVTRISALMQVTPERLNIREPFTAYGISSVEAVSISGELEDWLGRQLSPTLLYSYPTIETLVSYLAEDGSSVGGETSSLEKDHETGELIAIIGLGCRFPGAQNPAAFWQLLRNGVDAVCTIPPDRWDAGEFYDPHPATPGKMIATAGGFIPNVDKFDPNFFAIAPREADGIDPQQRILMEVAWEALEDAGIDPQNLRGSATGVFIGISTNDYSRLRSGDQQALNAYSGTGNASSIAANRLSYFFDFRGPSVAVDTACSSSLVAVHFAVQSLRDGESDMALVGGVNLILSPDLNITFSQAHMMSPSGRCKSFSAEADGYVRSEGCGVAVLKRVSEAVRDGDRILAVIRGSAVNQDGHSNGLTAPNGPSQEAVVSRALRRAQVGPEQIGYVETHGSGTPLGDPIEFNSLKSVLMRDRRPDQYCALGSVKTNIGHLEAASGIAGLIKTVLSLHHEEIPPLLHLKNINPHISLAGTTFQLPTQLTAWPRGNERRLAGVTSLGFGGTNVHVVLEEAPSIPTLASEKQRSQHILTISAQKQETLQRLAASYESFLGEHPNLAVGDLCCMSNTGRAHFAHRLSVVTPTINHLRDELAAFADGRETADTTRGVAPLNGQPRLVFLFPGQGSQYVGMGRELSQAEPVFRRALDQCAEVFDEYLDQPLLSVLNHFDGESSFLNQTAYTQPALFALEYSLAQLWLSWGIKPQAVMGHSVGEYTAACVAGVISLEDSLKLVAQRAALIQTLPPGGAMASVFAEASLVEEAIAPFSDRASIAAYNAPENITIAGDGEAIGKLREQFREEKVRIQTLNVSHAFHSPLIEPILGEFERIASQVEFREPQITWVSTVMGRPLEPGEIVDAKYWLRQVREAVKFSQGIYVLHEQGYRLFVEVGPGTALLATGKRCVPDTAGKWFPSLRERQGECRRMLRSLGGLYAEGVSVDWQSYNAGCSRGRVSLPTYPFERKRCWLGKTESKRALVERRSGDIVHSLLGGRIRSVLKESQYENQVSTQTISLLADHRVFGKAIFPAAGYLEAALAAATDSFGSGPHTLEEVVFHEPILVPEEAALTMQLILAPEDQGRSDFRIFTLREDSSGSTSWTLHAEGKVRINFVQPVENQRHVSLQEAQTACQDQLPVDLAYEQFAEAGINYGPVFQIIKKLWCNTEQALGHIEQSQGDSGNGPLPCTVLDACFQVFGAALFGHQAQEAGLPLYLPVGLQGLSLKATLGTAVWAWAVLHPEDPTLAGRRVGDLYVFNDDGDILLEVSGLCLRHVPDGSTLPVVQKPLQESLYEVVWETVERFAPDHAHLNNGQPSTWLILMDQTGAGDKLSQALEQTGDHCYRIFPAAHRSVLSESSWAINPHEPLDYHWLMEQVATRGSDSLRAIVHLWSLGGPTEELTVCKINEQQALGCGSVLSLVQALAKAKPAKSRRLLLVTRGAQRVDKTENSISVAQSAVLGLAKVITLEHPELSCSLVDLDTSDASDVNQLISELRAGSEPQVAFRKGKRYLPALLRCALATASGNGFSEALNGSPYQLVSTQLGLLENLTLQTKTRRPPGVGEVEIAVHASGLNFRDVMSALGLYPGDPGPLGSECSGVITAVGSTVADLRLGDKVVAIAPGVFSSHVTAHSQFVLRKPKNLDFEEAATIPINFLTAYYALYHLAHIAAGDRVLIHAAAGGVGLAAVQLAQRVGAEIFATAGSSEKREVLKSLGVKHLMSSRSLDFADELLKETNGRGVTVVLNSLAGEFIPKSLSVLEANGRFIEIGKNGIWESSEVSRYRKDVNYFVFDLAEVCRQEPIAARSMFQELMKHFEAGILKPTPRKVFSIHDAVKGFRYMAQARHIGKVVFSQAPAASLDEVAASPHLNPDSTYLITGGLGSLGLLIARWLVEQGARHLLLVSRSSPSAGAAEVLQKLRRDGTNIMVERADCSSPTDVSGILERLQREGPPLRGIVHAAGVLDDGVLLQQDWQRFASVLRPKVGGSWNLHLLTRDKPLDFFIMFSSAASLLGSPGQSSYAAANAFMDGLAHFRIAQGLPALSINWGPWAKLGMAASTGGNGARHWNARAMRPLEPAAGLEALKKLLHSSSPQVAVLNVDWSRLFRIIPGLGEQHFYSKIAAGLDDSKASGGGELLRQLQETPPDARSEVLMTYMRTQIAKVLEFDSAESVDVQRPLNELGLDSLMGVEIRNVMGIALDTTLPITLVYEYPTIESLTLYLLDSTFPESSSQKSEAKPADAAGGVDDLLAGIDLLSEAEAESLLYQKLSAPRNIG